MNIILCGFKNCGKTTTGRKLGERLRRRFLDIDEKIFELYLKDSNQAKVKPELKIAEIFNSLGEEKFRLLEKKAVEQAILLKDSIIATGGGTFLHLENALSLQASGMIVYLKMPKVALYERMLKNTLPAFLDKNALSLSFEKMYNERKKIFLDWSDHTVEVFERSLENIVEEIVFLAMCK